MKMMNQSILEEMENKLALGVDHRPKCTHAHTHKPFCTYYLYWHVYFVVKHMQTSSNKLPLATGMSTATLRMLIRGIPT